MGEGSTKKRVCFTVPAVSTLLKSLVPVLFLLVACGGAQPQAASNAPAASSLPVSSPLSVSDRFEAIAGDPDRSAEDRALDAGRKPAELLRFLGITSGMRVAELGAGGGYTAELFARAVGPTGRVFGQNSKFLLEKFAEAPWSERLKKPVMKNVERVDREFDEPLPESGANLDIVLINLFYHDTVWLKTDRAKMNRSIFRSLKSGGVYVVADHSAKQGTGVADAQTLHRIEASVVKSEVLAAGFVLAEEGTFLQNASDARDWSASPRTAAERRGQSDRFVFKFKKP